MHLAGAMKRLDTEQIEASDRDCDVHVLLVGTSDRSHLFYLGLFDLPWISGHLRWTDRFIDSLA